MIAKTANQPGAREKKYLGQQELGEVVLATRQTGALAETDPCGLTFISSQAGVIFEAQPIR